MRDHPEVSAWWASLEEEDRISLVKSYREEAPAQIIPLPDDDEPISDEVTGVFTDDFYEFLVNHEFFGAILPTRTYHICTAHEAARAAQLRGVLPPDFTCPLGHGEAECPIRRILSETPGKAFVLIRH